MAAKTMARTASQTKTMTESSIWKRLIRPDKADLTPDAARFFLKVEFGSKDRARMHRLSRKAQSGQLTDAEREEIAGYERIGTFLSIMKSKARKVLRDGDTV